MKNKKALWPWAKRMVMGETKASRRHTAGSKNTDAGFRDDTEPSYDSRPIEINEWFHTFMCMNIPIYGWFYLKKLAHQHSHNKMQDFARENNLDFDLYTHDIYLNDSRKTKTENLKSIMRIGIYEK